MSLRFQTPDAAVHHFDKGTETCVVCFSHSAAGQERKSLVAQSFLEKLGQSYIIIDNKNKDHWWTFDGVDNLIERTRFEIKSTRVVTYGFSMGGYGAIRFAGALGAEKVVAFAPQETITPSILPEESRWVEDAKRIGCEVPPASASFSNRSKYIVVYDPADADRFHAKRFRNASNRAGSYQEIRLPFAGHNLAATLQSQGMLSKFARGLLLDEQEAVGMVVSSYKDSRRKSPTALMKIQAIRYLCQRGALRSVRRLSESSLADICREAWADAIMLLYVDLTAVRLHDLALPFVLKAYATNTASIRYACHAAQCLLRNGRKQEALAIIEPHLPSGTHWVRELHNAASN